MKCLTLTPAYGRDYRSKKAVQTDWDANKDFTICDMSCPDDGRYANKTDLASAGYEEVNIRYKRLANVAVITV